MTGIISKTAVAGLFWLASTPGLAQQGDPQSPPPLSPVMADTEFMQITQAQALAERIISGLNVINSPYKIDPDTGMTVEPTPEETAVIVADAEQLIRDIVAEQGASPEVVERALSMVQARMTNGLGNTFALAAVLTAVSNTQTVVQASIASNQSVASNGQTSNGGPAPASSGGTSGGTSGGGGGGSDYRPV